MKIVLVSYNFDNNGSVASSRCIGFAKSLANQGYDVTVLTCAELSMKQIDNTNISLIRIANPLYAFLNRHFTSEKNASQSSTKNHSRLKAWFDSFRKKRGILFLGRMPDIADFWYINVRRYLKKAEPWDIVIASYAPYANLLAGSYIKKSQLADYYVADFRDPWSGHHLFKGLFPFRHIEKKIEQRITGTADLVTLATPALKSRLLLSPSIRSQVIYNGYPDSGRNQPLSEKTTMNTITLIHAGSVYPHKQDISTFFSAISQPEIRSHKNLSIVFIGNEKSYINALAKQYGVSDVVTHLGIQDKKHCWEHLSAANIGLCFSTNNTEFIGVIPSKLSDYIKFKLPILYITNINPDDATERMKEYPLFKTAGYSTQDISQALKQLLLEPCQAENSVRFAFDSFSQDHCNRLLINELQRLGPHS